MRGNGPFGLRIFWRVRRLLLALPALAIVAGVVYWFLFSYVHPWLLEDAQAADGISQSSATRFLANRSLRAVRRVRDRPISYSITRGFG